MVSYVKARSKKNMKIFCEKVAMESWHSVCNSVDVDTACINFIQVIDNLFSKCCPIIIIRSKRQNVDKPWMTTGLKNKTTLYCIS